MGYRVVRVNGEIFDHLMTQGNRWPDCQGRTLVVDNGLPEGAKLVAMSIDLYFLSNQIALRFSHPSWPDLPEGCATPELQIRYRIEETQQLTGEIPEPTVIEGE